MAVLYQVNNMLQRPKNTVTGLAFRFHNADSLCTEPPPPQEKSEKGPSSDFSSDEGAVYTGYNADHMTIVKTTFSFGYYSFPIMRQGIKSPKILGCDLQREKRYKGLLSVETKRSPWLIPVRNNTKKVYEVSDRKLGSTINNFSSL